MVSRPTLQPELGVSPDIRKKRRLPEIPPIEETPPPSAVVSPKLIGDTFSLISRLYPSFPGLKRAELPVKLDDLRTFAGEDPEGFLFDLNTKANPEERDSVLRALGVGEEEIVSLQGFGEQQRLTNLAITVFPELESLEDFSKLVETDTNSFLKTMQTGGETPEKRQLLQTMGFEPEEIEGILGNERIVVELDGIRQQVTRTSDNSLYDEFGNWVGFYNWSDGTVFNPYKAEGLGEKARASFVTGIGDILSVSSGVALRFGYEDAASQLSETASQLQRNAVPTTSADFEVSDLLNPEFYATKITRTIPFALSLAPLAVGGYYAGAGLAAVAGLGAIWTAIVGGGISALLTRPLESALEAGGSYNDAIARGKTEKEAQEEFDEVFRNNMTLVGADAFEIAVALAPTPSWVPKALVKGGLARTVRIGGKVIIVGLSEGGEEVYQDLIQRHARGEEFQLDPISKEVFAIGFVMGAGMGLGGDVISGIVNTSKDGMSAQQRREFDETINRFKEEGINQSESELRALDEFMKTPEGDKIVNEAIDENKPELVEPEEIPTIEPTEGVTPVTEPVVTPEVPVVEPTPSVVEALPVEGATKRVFDRIQIEPAEPNVVQKAKKGYNTFQVQMVDDLYNLKKTRDVLRKGGVEFSIEEDPYVAARLLKGITGKVNTFLEQGTFGKKFWKTEKGEAVPNYTGESLESILREVRKPTDWQDFSTYMVARRTVELNSRDIETGINIDDANNAITDLESRHKNFPDLSKRLNKYQDSLLVYSQEMGLISSELLGKLRKNADYVPFYRVFNELQSRGFMGKKMADIANPIKRIKGSEREIINPLESIVKNTYVMISAADRNNVGIMLANLVDQNPELVDVFERVPTPITKVAQTSAKELGVEIEGMTEADMEQVVDIFRPSFFVPGNEVTVLIDGKKQFYKVDKDLRDALLNLTREDIGMMGKILSAPAKWLRAGAILSPDFMARNPARDQLSAFSFSNYGFLPGFDFLKGVASILTQTGVAARVGITADASYQLFRQSGAEHAMMVSMDREYLQKSFKEITEGKRFTSYIKHPVELLRLGSEFGERATRLGEFKKGIARGVTPTEAGLAAREVTLDFAKAGATAHALNRYIPFFNANIRGWDKMIISFKEHPTRTAAKVFMGITLPSIILYLVNRDDPRWDEIPQWQKDLFWIVMTEDNIFRIPKPFELGILFGSIPERFLEYLDKRDPELLKGVLLSAAETGSPGFIPQALLPIIENLTNFNFFKGREIVPKSRQSLPPELQYTRYTTTVSKEVGELINYSPAKIDNLINAWTGGLGRYATNILDAILEGTGIVPTIPEPSPTLADVPVLKAFIVRDPFGAQNESVNKFYEKMEDYQKNENALKQFLKTGDIIKFNELKEKHPELLFFYDLENDVAYSASARYLRKVARDLSELRKRQDEVFKHKAMTSEEKRIKIDEIDRLKVGVAKRALDLFPAEGPIVLEKQLFDASNQLGDILNDVPLLAREKPDIYNMLDLSNSYKETLKGITLADLEGKKIPSTVPAWYDKEESLDTHDSFPSVDLIKINNDPKKGFTFEDYISQWQERQLITDPEELKEFDKRFKNAHQGNLTPGQISALRDYYSLSDDEQELFLDGHPELREDPRDEWLKDNPEDNARLAIWGQANILTQDAYDFAQRMIKDLKLPLKALPEFTLPPKGSVESHFKYLETIKELSASSAEVRLILANDDAYREWRGLDEIDVPTSVLELQIKNRELDDRFEALETDEERDTFREVETEWVDDQRRIVALRKGASDKIVNSWLDRGKLIDEFSSNSSRAQVWLLDNQETYQWAIDNGLLEDRIEELKEREPILRINIQLEGLEEDSDEFIRLNYRKDALQIDFPMVDTYVEWYTDSLLRRPDALGEGLPFYEDDWYLMEHPEFYKAMLGAGIFTTRRDFRLVPMKDGKPDRVVGAKYIEYLGIKNNQAKRGQLRLDNSDLDEWGVSVGIWTTTMSEKRRRQAQTPTERFEEDVAEAERVRRELLGE